MLTSLLKPSLSNSSSSSTSRPLREGLTTLIIIITSSNLDTDVSMARIKTKIIQGTHTRTGTETKIIKTGTTIIKGISLQGGTSKWWRWRGSIETSQWIRIRPSKGEMCWCKFSNSLSLSRTVRPSTIGASTDLWTVSLGVTGISRMNRGRSRAAEEGGSASTEWLERHNPSTREWMLTSLWISQFRGRDKLRWMITGRSWRLTLSSWTLPLIWVLSHSQYLFHNTNKLPKGSRIPQISSCHPMRHLSDLIINSR